MFDHALKLFSPLAMQGLLGICLVTGCTLQDVADLIQQSPQSEDVVSGRPPAELAVTNETHSPTREGPWHMQCFVEDELVLDLPEVYRIRRDTAAGGWIYVTDKGTVVRGRITTGANCVWLRPEDETIETPGS